MKPAVLKKYRELMASLGSDGAPLVAYYSDQRPVEYIGPRGRFFIDIKKPGDIFSFLGKARNLDNERKASFRCLFGFLARTRTKNIPSVFDADNFGCPGCRFYLGFIDEIPGFNHFFISTGFPGVYNGERFAPTPASSRRHANQLKGIRQKGKYVVFESIERMSFDVEPEVVIFFCNAETLSGLVGLVRFATDEPDSVQSPYSSGCGSIFSWPLKYSMEGSLKAVLGIFDPAARPYLPLGEMTLRIPFPLFMRILATFKKSFIYADKIKSGLIKSAIPSWPNVRQRAKRIRSLIKNANTGKAR
jgi:uncharacterized protein (DUF169 family)